MHNKVSRRVIARTVAAKLLAEPAKRVHWVQVLAAYLVENHRTDQADLLLNDIAHELYAQHGHLLTNVTSARKLTDGIRDELKRTLQATTGASHVELDEQLDPALIGGLVARTSDHQLDASVRTKLKQLASL